jgi:hypothetical protein
MTVPPLVLAVAGAEALGTWHGGLALAQVECQG